MILFVLLLNKIIKWVIMLLNAKKFIGFRVLHRTKKTSKNTIHWELFERGSLMEMGDVKS